MKVEAQSRVRFFLLKFSVKIYFLDEKAKGTNVRTIRFLKKQSSPVILLVQHNRKGTESIWTIFAKNICVEYVIPLFHSFPILCYEFDKKVWISAPEFWIYPGFPER